jgi:hypothetical protein
MSQSYLLNIDIRPLSRLEALLAFLKRKVQNNERSDCSGGGEASPPVKIPLLPERPSPEFLLCFALFAFGGFWLSDYGLLTPKYSEPVASAMAAFGWFVGVVSGAVLLLSLMQAYY